MPNTYLLNALPNALIIPDPDHMTVIAGIHEARAIALFKDGGISAIGHQSTADVLARRGFEGLAMNRIQVEPSKGDLLVIASFIAGRRLAEGELFTEAEILSFKIKYALIRF